jgi:hypothetical protein
MSDHSPGPWMAVRSVPAEGFDCWWIMDGGTSIVADCPGYSPSGSAQSAANAHLIASAPELLSALKDLVDVMTGRMAGETVALHNALAALRKAGTAGEGEK